MANPGLSEVIVTTARNRRKKLRDGVGQNRALMGRLSKKGNNRLVGGGRTLVEEVEYAENGTFGYYSGYDNIDISPQDVMTAFEFAWKQAAGAISISGLEELMNSGDEQYIDLLEARFKNLERTLKNNISSGIYSTGTGSGSKQIGGLQLLVPDDPTTGTIGGINRATAGNTWARSLKYSGVTDGGGAVSEANIQRYLTALIVQLVRDSDKPDIGVGDNTYWSDLHNSMTAIQRIVDQEIAKAGFMNIEYMGIPFVLDGGYGGDSPSAHMYVLNTDFIYFKTHNKRDFEVIGGERESVNQDATVKIVGWAGNMTISVPFLQGVLIA